MATNHNTPLLQRSSLTVPLSNERFIAKAHLRGADTIMLDLEDGVAPNAKAAARDRLADAVKMVRRGGARIKVRLNRPLDLLVRDIEAAVIEGVDELAIAKVDSAAHVRLVSEFVGQLEAARALPLGAIALSAAIETPQALLNVNEIARADSRLSSIGLGSLDFAAACGFEANLETLHMPKQMVLFAAKAAGIHSGGYIGSIADYTDLAGFRQIVRHSKKLGFHGGGAIHPAQVQILNEEFAPNANEVDEARALVEAAELAFAEGRGAFAWGGKMVDKPVVDAARATLVLADAVKEHQLRCERLLAGSVS